MSSLFSPEKVIEQQGKIVELERRLKVAKGQLAGASNEIEEARAALVSAIVGVDQAQHHPADSKTGSFERVKLSKLVNIFLRKPVVKPVVKPVKHQQKGLPAVDTPPRNDAPGQGGSKVDTGDAGPGWLLDSLKKSEKELVHRNDKIRTLESQIKTLLGAGVGARPQTVGGLTMPPLSPLVPGGQRRRSSVTAPDIDTLRAKQQSLNEQIWALKRKVKDRGKEAAHWKEKNLKLAEQIEKVMYHLKSEVAAKSVISSRLERAERKTKKQAKLRNEERKKVVRLNGTIASLNEGCRVLEEQLRMLDGRFLDMKRTLDWTRSSNQLEMKTVGTEFVKLHTKIKENYEKYRVAQDKLNMLMRDVREEKKKAERMRAYDQSLNRRSSKSHNIALARGENSNDGNSEEEGSSEASDGDENKGIRG